MPVSNNRRVSGTFANWIGRSCGSTIASHCDGKSILNANAHWIFSAIAGVHSVLRRPATRTACPGVNFGSQRYDFVDFATLTLNYVAG